MPDPLVLVHTSHKSRPSHGPCSGAVNNMLKREHKRKCWGFRFFVIPTGGGDRSPFTRHALIEFSPAVLLSCFLQKNYLRWEQTILKSHGLRSFSICVKYHTPHIQEQEQEYVHPHRLFGCYNRQSSISYRSGLRSGPPAAQLSNRATSTDLISGSALSSPPPRCARQVQVRSGQVGIRTGVGPALACVVGIDRLAVVDGPEQLLVARLA